MSYSVKIQILLSETVNVIDIDWKKGNIVKVFLNPLLCQGALDLYDVRRVLRGKGLKIKLNSCLLTILLSRNSTRILHSVVCYSLKKLMCMSKYIY